VPRTFSGDDELGLLVLVRTEVADVMGFDSPDDVDPDETFVSLGLDSMSAVQLSTSLARATGLELSVTLGFDHPTSAAVAQYLCRTLGGADGETQPAEPRDADGDEDDPIVIVGMGCRFPGGVRSPQDLFELVAQGVDAITDFPTDRGWPIDGLFHPDPAHPHTSYVREGGFMDNVDAFDAAFFGISPREATATDPQQRLLLETAWEAFEDARVDPTAMRGSATGVFVGLATHDHYGSRARSVPDELEGHFGLGNAGSVASGRVAYALGLEGPALTVDTACSSSLVALHLACSALRQGECTMALAGGVSVLTTPETFVVFSRQRSLSRDGRCKAFSASADGTGFAEGVGLVLLERLSDARRLGHRELAIVRGSAINQDGASNGITAPHGPAQERVIRQALVDARLGPLDVDVVEGHGTGTELGDPIEARSLVATYGAGRPDDRPLWLGSLKSNIGHAQAAAGVGGIIKLVMAMRHGMLPRTLHVDEPTPHVDWSDESVRLLVESSEWSRIDRPRRGAVSSFGISGTNAHIILEEPSAKLLEPSDPATEDFLTPWVISGRSASALRAQCARLHAHLEQQPGVGLLDVAHSLVSTRALHEHRAVVLGHKRGELLAGLETVAAGTEAPNVVSGRTAPRGPVTFIFPGQGTHWAGMARELGETSPVFTEHLGAAANAFAPYLDWSLEAVLKDEPGAPSMDRVEVVQPTLFAVMISLAALWRSFGVEPDMVIGHSQGEIAAAHVAGALTLEDAARIVALRSRALTGVAGRGGMISLALPIDDVERRLERHDNQLSVAAINGPTSVVVSGDMQALNELLSESEEEGVWVRLLPGDVPGHSPYIDELRERLLSDLACVEPLPSSVGFASGVTGSLHDPASLDAEYWFRNTRNPVRFCDAVRAVVEQGCRTFVEVSPHPVLTVGVSGTLEAAEVDVADTTIVGSLRRGDGGTKRFATSVSELHVRGQHVNWEPLLSGREARTVDLPTYAFDRSRFWLEAHESTSAEPAAAGLRATPHPLLGATVDVAGRQEQILCGRVALSADGWLADHAVLDTILLPGTAFVELAVRAAREVDCNVVEELTLEAPLVLAEDVATQLQVWVGEPDDTARRAVSIASRPETSDGEDLGWTQHATGTLGQAPPLDSHTGGSGAWPPVGGSIDIQDLYSQWTDRGIGYGPMFQALRTAWRSDEAVIAEVSLDEDSAGAAKNFEIHPALLDAAFHAMGDRLPDTEPGQTWLPFSWKGVQIHRRGMAALRVRLSPTSDGVRLLATNEFGELVVSVDSVVVRQVSAAQLAAAVRQRGGLFVIDWRPCPVRTERSVRLAVLGDGVPGLHAERHTDVNALATARDGSSQSPDVLLVPLAPSDAEGELVPAARAATQRTLQLVQEWLADDRLCDTQFALLTQGAVSATQSEAADPVGATVWGLLRTARFEHPDRVLLLDVDDTSASEDALVAALSAGEPELAIREGRLLAPRLVRAPTTKASKSCLNPDGTVLVTGGMTGLGASVARHLVNAHGVRRLLLASRRGGDTPHAVELQAELSELGAEVTLAACDVADRDALAALLAQVSSKHPLTGVVHSAGVLEDGILTSLTPEKLDRVLRPKIDAGDHLHELTKHLDLGAFVLFSSIAGTFGGAGQGNYAAANAFLDALAQRRHAAGLVGTSIAWGLWADASEMGGRRDEGDLGRLARLGVAPLTNEDGLALLDAALALDSPLVIAARLDVAGLRTLAHTGTVPPLLRGLAGASTSQLSGPRESLTGRLAGIRQADRSAVVLELVRGHTAAILGHASSADVEPRRAFKDLGFDSLAAVELRNRLVNATGLRLPSTMVFDHPSISAVAEHLLELVAANGTVRSPVDEHVEQLEALLAANDDDDERDRVKLRLRTLLEMLDSPVPDSTTQSAQTAERLRNAGADEIFEFIDQRPPGLLIEHGHGG
jgi:acyl transferase domain-containing protein/NAD(P)-dependent dehydrogenase (short-subunit alcohol dehydrogenase family)/acyl carrier protein